MMGLISVMLLLSSILGQISLPFPGPGTPVTPTGACSSGGAGGYACVEMVTISDLLVGSSSSSNFPMYFAGTYPYLATIANNGKAKSSSGYDIVFSLDSGCSSLLSWEQEYWSGNTGKVVYWVQIPTLSHTSNTVIYLCVGNSSISSFQGGTLGDTSLKGWWTFQEGTGSSAYDYSGNSNTANWQGTQAGTSGYYSAGYVGPWAGTFDGSDNYVVTGGAPSLNIYGTPAMSVALWVKRSSSGSLGQLFVNPGYGSGVDFEITVNVIANNIKMTKFGVVDIYINNCLPTDTNWHQFVGVWSSTGTYIYVDGSETGSSSDTSNIASNSNSVAVLGSTTWSGLIDDERVYSRALSADWIAASFNNQSSPGTFYSVSP